MTRQTDNAKTFAINFLLYTRATSFDYRWIYGLEDRFMEKALHDHVLNWLDFKLLAKIRRVTTFFKFKTYHALMIAEQSETRTDTQSRPIFQRAMFLWKPVDELYYRHVSVLAALLEETANEVYGNLPKDVMRMSTATRQYPVDLKELNRMSSKPRSRRATWQLPEGFTWTDAINRALTVEVPQSWTFERMIDGVADLPLLATDVIHIGNALNFENRCPGGIPWIVSAKSGDGDSEEIRILDAQGHPVPMAPIIKRTRGESSTGQVSPRISEFHDDGSGVAPDQGQAKAGAGARSSTEAEKKELERLFLEFSNFGQNDSDKVGLIKKFFERYDVAIRSAETRILMLLIPAKHEISNEIVTSWHLLISEILLSYQAKNIDLTNEWIRRCYKLEDITNQNLTKAGPQWRSEFKAACEALRMLLHDGL